MSREKTFFFLAILLKIISIHQKTYYFLQMLAETYSQMRIENDEIYSWLQLRECKTLRKCKKSGGIWYYNSRLNEYPYPDPSLYERLGQNTNIIYNHKSSDYPYQDFLDWLVKVTIGYSPCIRLGDNRMVQLLCWVRYCSALLTFWRTATACFISEWPHLIRSCRVMANACSFQSSWRNVKSYTVSSSGMLE